MLKERRSTDGDFAAYGRLMMVLVVAVMMMVMVVIAVVVIVVVVLLVVVVVNGDSGDCGGGISDSDIISITLF